MIHLSQDYCENIRLIKFKIDADIQQMLNT